MHEPKCCSTSSSVLPLLHAPARQQPNRRPAQKVPGGRTNAPSMVVGSAVKWSPVGHKQAEQSVSSTTGEIPRQQIVARSALQQKKWWWVREEAQCYKRPVGRGKRLSNACPCHGQPVLCLSCPKLSENE